MITNELIKIRLHDDLMEALADIYIEEGVTGGEITKEQYNRFEGIIDDTVDLFNELLTQNKIATEKERLNQFNNELLHYGTILSKIDICDNNCDTIRTIEYNKAIYVSHMQNGEVISINKIKG